MLLFFFFRLNFFRFVCFVFVFMDFDVLLRCLGFTAICFALAFALAFTGVVFVL